MTAPTEDNLFPVRLKKERTLFSVQAIADRLSGFEVACYVNLLCYAPSAVSRLHMAQ